MSLGLKAGGLNIKAPQIAIRDQVLEGGVRNVKVTNPRLQGRGLPYHGVASRPRCIQLKQYTRSCWTISLGSGSQSHLNAVEKPGLSRRGNTGPSLSGSHVVNIS
jgi:hypothetical protein